jgi:hypothetical protein
MLKAIILIPFLFLGMALFYILIGIPMGLAVMLDWINDKFIKGEKIS